MASRPFYDFLREHRNGSTHDELADALNELVAAVNEKRPGVVGIVAPQGAVMVEGIAPPALEQQVYR